MKKILYVFVLIIVFVYAAIFSGCITQEPSVGDCSGDGSCNIYPPGPILPQCDPGENLITLWVDIDQDGLPEEYEGAGLTQYFCMGNSVEIPEGFVDHPGPPWDPCPNDPTNLCGNGNLTCLLTATAAGHTVDLNVTANSTNSTVSNVEFYGGSILLVTDPDYPYHYDWTNVPNGVYTMRAICEAADGNTAHSNQVTATINDSGNMCIPQIRCTYHLSEGTRFNGIIAGFLTSINGQDPAWQYLPYQTCGWSNSACLIQGNLWPNALNQGHAELQGTAPSGLNGNPIPSFTSTGGYGTDWMLTSYLSGNTLIYNNEMSDLLCEVNPQCTGWFSVQDSTTTHSWGSNIILDFTDVVDPITGDSINLFIGTYIDSDQDNFYDYCPPSIPTCVPDNCIRYANPNQADSNSDGIGDACVDHPDPLDNDSDNDWHLDGEDNFPYDRTRF